MRRRLREDLRNSFPPLGDMNFAESRCLPDPLAGVVVKFPDRYRLHVTHGDT